MGAKPKPKPEQKIRLTLGVGEVDDILHALPECKLKIKMEIALLRAKLES